MAMERRKNKKYLWKQIAAMLLIAGLTITLLCGCSHEKNDRIQTEPSAPPESKTLDTMAQVVAYVEGMAKAGATEFSMVCAADVYDALIKTTYTAGGVERKAFHGLLNQAGIRYCSTTTAAMKKTITVTDISFYPGYEILRNIEAGREDTLPSMLQKTLAEARSMADACRTSDPLETAKKHSKRHLRTGSLCLYDQHKRLRYGNWRSAQRRGGLRWLRRYLLSGGSSGRLGDSLSAWNLIQL
jgi:hypothetical protein